MCFGFRKKVLRRQEEILKKLEEAEQANRAGREAITTAMTVSNTALIGGIKTTLDAVVGNVDIMRKTNETRIAEVNATLDKNLSEIRFNMEKSLKDVREDNEKQLGAMRNVVEQKLTETLGERLSSTFNAINERLDAVNKGLGEMQSLNNGVTDLRKVLSNVKTRGIWGEVSLENLLDGILTREQYVIQKNVSGKRNGEAVDFAVVLPGKSEGKVYLPIDVKFPLEDYQRLVDSSESGNVVAMQEAVKGLENAIKTQAKSIKEKYLNPPLTTDFALMYLPIEGLYAEVIRNPGLIEELQSRYKVVPCGPTTISAILNSLQLGFRTLAIQRSSKEVFDLLAAFRKDFEKFVSNLDQAQRQVEGAGRTLEDATKRTSIIMKKLNKVETLPLPEAEE